MQLTVDYHCKKVIVGHALTTVTAHWFQEQGFVEVSLNELPTKKKQLYNFQRKSKVFKLIV
ncbi:MAG: amino-acid N-acetyltransferase [Oleiphilaceae bacterium]|jgi:amino-acid N-acetyltransferase